jgi:pSer/pThr/pTyr-binding forkhead associated (FHA) protein
MPAPTPSAGFQPKPIDPPVLGRQFGNPTPSSGAAQFGGAAASSDVFVPATPPPPSKEPARPVKLTPPVVEASTTVVCKNCGSTVPASFKFCGSCGYPTAQSKAPSEPPPQSGTASSPAPARVTGKLVVIQPDGTDGPMIPLNASTIVGRQAGGPFASDGYLSVKHATFRLEGSTCFVRDESSLNGIYFRVEAEVPHELVDGSIFRIGQEIIRFELIKGHPPTAEGVERMGSPNPGYLGRILLVIGRQTTGNAYSVPPEGMHLGRERGDIIFPDDGYVSGLHCRIHAEGGKIFLTDVGSSNGTFLRVRGEMSVPSGTLLLMGHQVCRLTYASKA